MVNKLKAFVDTYAISLNERPSVEVGVIISTFLLSVWLAKPMVDVLCYSNELDAQILTKQIVLLVGLGLLTSFQALFLINYVLPRYRQLLIELDDEKALVELANDPELRDLWLLGKKIDFDSGVDLDRLLKNVGAISDQVNGVIEATVDREFARDLEYPLETTVELDSGYKQEILETFEQEVVSVVAK